MAFLRELSSSQCIKVVDDCVAKNDNDGMSKRRVLADYQAMRNEFDHATDRAVAVLGAAYVEEALLDAGYSGRFS
jgi:hypothetical protein